LGPAKRSGKSGRSLRLLVVTLELPRPDHNGGDLRLFALLRQLAPRHCVVVYPLHGLKDAGEIARYEEMLRGIGVGVLPAGWVYGLERALFERAYDCVLFEFWSGADDGAALVRRHQPWARVIIDTVDIGFRRDADGLAVGISDPATVEANKLRELAAYRNADAVVCVSEEDGRTLDAQGGIARRFTIPLAVPERPRSVMPRGRELLFLGGFRHLPNRDGLLWFVRESWPAIRAAVPLATLTIIGSQLIAEVTDLSKNEGIDVIGYVPEVGPPLDRAALMVAPLRFGAGVKTKVVEAMAAGLPVVTTSVGAQGLDVISGEHLMIADEPAEFARHVVELLGAPDRAERIGRAGREYVTSVCSPEVIAECLESMLAWVVERPRPMILPRRWLLRSARSYLGAKKSLLKKRLLKRSRPA
jgi:glycosyltransferase involved in cell wall biosynthesis